MIYQDIISRNDIEIMSFQSSDVLIQNKEPRIKAKQKKISRNLFFVSSFSKILQTNSVTHVELLPEFNNDTVLKENSNKEEEQKQLLSDVSEIVTKILDSDKNGIFKEIDRSKLLNDILELFKETSILKNKISYDELFERVKRILVIEAMFGMLKELKSEQLELFDDAIKRRPLFG